MARVNKNSDSVTITLSKDNALLLIELLDGVIGTADIEAQITTKQFSIIRTKLEKQLWKIK